MQSSTLILTDSLKSLFIDTAKRLNGTERRQFMAQVVEELGVGGQSCAERELGWNRGTIRKVSDVNYLDLSRQLVGRYISNLRASPDLV